MNLERTCPACGESRFRDHDVLPGLVTHTCTRCGLILSTVGAARVTLRGTLPEFALVDQDAYRNSVGAVRLRQAVQILSLLRRHVPPGSRLLDVGCSFGFFLLEARTAGFDVRGIEPDLQAFESARAALGEGVVQHGLLSPDTAPPGSADVICTLDVLEHVPVADQATFASLTANALSPGGLWLIKVPSTEGLYYKLSDLLLKAKMGASFTHRLWQTRYEFPHLVYFSLPTLTTWLERYGFEVLDHRYPQEVPNDTVLDRLTTDHDITRRRAYVLAPAVVGVNLVEAIRRRSDSLVVLARPRAG